MPAPIVMIHGAFCGGWTFDQFRHPFEAAGHAVITPDLPGHAPDARPGAVTGVSMSDYARAVAKLCADLDEPPILLGHSMGGLVAQMAAARVKPRALVLLAPSAPWGVTGVTLEEAASAMSLYALGPYWTMAIDPDYPSARRYSFDRLARPERRALFSRMTPESGRALWETLNWWLDPFATTLVPTQGVRWPVLAIAGGKDAVHPPGTVRQTAARLGGELRVFDEMSHWLPGEPGWERVSETVLDWLDTASAKNAA